jgi:ABC-type transporter Mla MlaB component
MPRKCLTVAQHIELSALARAVDGGISAMLRIMNGCGLTAQQIRLIGVSSRLRGVLMVLEEDLYRDHPDDLVRNNKVY